MLPRKTFTTLALTAALAACGGNADDADAANSAMSEAAPVAAAPVAADLSRCFLRGATVEESADRPSPLRATAFRVGDTTGQICYGAPAARDRVVMGELVPFDQPWRSGANEATAIHLDGPATIGGVALAAGSYSLYTIPGTSSWEVVLNSNVERWGIPISPEVRATDVGSFTVTPEATSNMVETMTYGFESTGQSAGEIVLEWETTRVRIPVAAGM
ncbi:MAG: DUF2911 domain-containing protein [Thioalkalivibrio sp.]|nr:DUF2911 domain-containing protein [Thioalkalivibrio sp.]